MTSHTVPEKKKEQQQRAPSQALTWIFIKFNELNLTSPSATVRKIISAHRSTMVVLSSLLLHADRYSATETVKHLVNLIAGQLSPSLAL